MEQSKRRRFLRNSTLATAAAITPVTRGISPNERIQVGMIGAAGRARSLNLICAKNPEIDIVAVADVDVRNLPRTVEEVTRIQGKKPGTTQDFRELIESEKIDALVVGTPDHWHAIPTILGCLNGKDVYVEKPDAHNIVEGRRMIAAAKKHDRIIQVGSQHRSNARLQTALAYIREGNLGRALVAKAWESYQQGSIGHPPDEDPPPGVDYDMWIGPARKLPFNRNRFHGRWRWFFDLGTGDLGNDGIHRLDQAYAALSAAVETEGGDPLAFPESVSAMGGKWYFDDMQEWPDTMQVNYTYAGKPPRLLTYEMKVWTPYPYLGVHEGAAVFGDNGYIVIGNRGWKAYDDKGKMVKEFEGGSDATPHIQDWVDCIRSRKRPLCDLETVGHPASVLCHAGNIAWRVGRTLKIDPGSETFLDDGEANALRGREEWRAPWILPEVS